MEPASHLNHETRLNNRTSAKKIFYRNNNRLNWNNNGILNFIFHGFGTKRMN